MYKVLGDFRIHFDYQTFSYNSLGDEIDVQIHKTISFQGYARKDCWINIAELNNTKNAITTTFDIKTISQDHLNELLSAMEDYITYMELLGKLNK